jgi:hypothetical protein
MSETKDKAQDAARYRFLQTLHEFHVDGGYDEGDPVTLCVVEGNINDREYREIGKGDTLDEAIDQARARTNRPTP